MSTELDFRRLSYFVTVCELAAGVVADPAEGPKAEAGAERLASRPAWKGKKQ